MNFLNTFLKNRRSSTAIKVMQSLGTKFFSGLSTEYDLGEWEKNLGLISGHLRRDFDHIFLKYLLKHFPNDNRLNKLYADDNSIDVARDSLYIEVLLITIGDALYMLRYKAKIFLGTLDNWKRVELIEKIERYVSFRNDNREYLINKDVDNHPDFPLIEDLEGILMEIYSYMPYNQNEWRIKAKNIVSFKYLDYDEASVFRRRQELTSKHGILLGEGGSGKTTAIQREIEFILENTNDDIIVIDNDCFYEDFCSQYHGEYIKITPDSTFFDDYTTTNNRLVVLNLHNGLHVKDRFTYASKALLYAQLRISEPSNLSKKTWIYIEELNELIFDNYFLRMKKTSRLYNGVITIATNHVMDIIDNINSQEILLNCGYIRVFKQSISVRERLAKFISFDPNLLNINDVYMSWAILGNKTLKIKDKIYN